MFAHSCATELYSRRSTCSALRYANPVLWLVVRKAEAAGRNLCLKRRSRDILNGSRASLRQQGWDPATSGCSPLAPPGKSQQFAHGATPGRAWIQSLPRPAPSGSAEPRCCRAAGGAAGGGPRWRRHCRGSGASAVTSPRRASNHPRGRDAPGGGRGCHVLAAGDTRAGRGTRSALIPIF